jgi:hypothetical protein
MATGRSAHQLRATDEHLELSLVNFSKLEDGAMPPPLHHLDGAPCQ